MNEELAQAKLERVERQAKYRWNSAKNRIIEKYGVELSEQTWENLESMYRSGYLDGYADHMEEQWNLYVPIVNEEPMTDVSGIPGVIASIERTQTSDN
jgi:hypothetical protein